MAAGSGSQGLPGHLPSERIDWMACGWCPVTTRQNRKRVAWTPDVGDSKGGCLILIGMSPCLLLGFLVPVQRGLLLSRGGVPQPHRAVPASRRNQFAVAEGHGMHPGE